jgi:16S rRNA (guanine966-N2)-methyltransferase
MANTKLRISGGSARGLPLSEPRGFRLRPTSGMVREAIFNIVGDRIDGARVLDLYAGTGALGIESISRGASHATLVEAERAACEAILQSLGRAGFTSQATLIRGRLPAALKSVSGLFDIILMDPPYNEETAIETLDGLARLLTDEGLIVYEHGSRYNPPGRPEGLVLQERRIYGDSALALYGRQEGE